MQKDGLFFRSWFDRLTTNGYRCFAVRPELVEGRREILAFLVRLAHHQRAVAPSVTDVESGLLFIFSLFRQSRSC